MILFSFTVTEPLRYVKQATVFFIKVHSIHAHKRKNYWLTFDYWVRRLLSGLVHDSRVTYRYAISDTGSIVITS